MKTTNLTILAAILTLVLWATGAAAADVRPGETIDGQVAGAGAEAVLDMDLAAGDEVSLSLKAGGNGLAPDLAVLAPSGVTVASASDEAKAKLSFCAAETGTYQLRLASNDDTAPRFTLKVRGDESRKYTDRSGAFEFGVRAGSRIEMKVKARSEAGLMINDGNGSGVDASYTGSGKSRKAVVYAASENDDYTVVFDGKKAKLKVKVSYPASRGHQALTMTPAPDAAPAASAAPQQTQPQAGNGNTQNGSTQNGNTQNGNTPAGTAGNAGNAGAAPAPAPIADHVYLMVLLAEKSDAGLEKIRAELKHDADQPAFLMIDALQAACDDAIVADINNVLSGINRPLSSGGVDAVVDLIAAQRRADRARASLAILAQDIAASTLAGDIAFDAGRAQTEAELARLDDAIAYALTRGLASEIAGRNDGSLAPSFDAPSAPAAANEVINGLVALDAAVLSGPIMTRARNGEAAAVELAEALYGTYETLLNANPGAVANPAANLSAISQARAELAAQIAVDFEIALVSRPNPDANAAYEMDIVAFGAADAAQVEYEVVGSEDAATERTETGLKIRMPAHTETMNLHVTARYAGAERNLDITVAPRMDEQPQTANLHGRVVNSFGHGVVGAHYEIRDPAGMDNPLAMGETGDDGHFHIDQVPAGEWVLVIMTEQGEMEMPLTVEPRPENDTQEIDEIQID